MSIILKLTPKEDVDFTQIVVNISNDSDINLKDYDVEQICHPVISFKDEIEEYILKNGFSSLINTQPLLEHIVPPGETSAGIINVMHRYLDSIQVDEELIIVDPYFFAKTSEVESYSNIIKKILKKYQSKLEKIRIVTLPNKVDFEVKNNIKKNIKELNESIDIVHVKSGKFHDRFWISNNRSKGVITGTSINGLGKRYALVDRIDDFDVKSIINGLKTENLL